MALVWLLAGYLQDKIDEDVERLSMNICRMIADFPRAKDIDEFNNQRSSYLLSGAYYISRAQVALGDNVSVLTGGGPKHESVGGMDVTRVGNPDNLSLAFELLHLRKNDGVDIIHGHSTYGFLALRILKRFIGAPVAMHVHATTAGLFDSHYGRLYPPTGRGAQSAYVREKFVFSFADRLVAVSDNIARALVRLYGIDTSKVVVVRNGVDTSLFRPTPKANAKRAIGLGDERIVLFVGRLSAIKGIEYLIRAAQVILDEFDNVTFLLAGGVPTFMKRGQVDVHGMLAGLQKGSNKKRVRLLGPVPNNLLPAYYAAADVVVAPSLFEAAPKVILEAMACGAPVVATDVGGVPEVMSNGFNGLIIPPADSNSLSSAISLLLRDESLRSKLGRNAVETVSEHFTWRQTAVKLREMYQVMRA